LTYDHPKDFDIQLLRSKVDLDESRKMSGTGNRTFFSRGRNTIDREMGALSRKINGKVMGNNGSELMVGSDDETTSNSPRIKARRKSTGNESSIMKLPQLSLSSDSLPHVGSELILKEKKEIVDESTPTNLIPILDSNVIPPIQSHPPKDHPLKKSDRKLKKSKKENRQAFSFESLPKTNESILPEQKKSKKSSKKHQTVPNSNKRDSEDDAIVPLSKKSKSFWSFGKKKDSSNTNLKLKKSKKEKNNHSDNIPPREEMAIKRSRSAEYTIGSLNTNNEPTRTFHTSFH